MKVIFIHYSFLNDGVTRVVFNNIEGLRRISKEIQFALVANSFSSPFPDFVEERLIDWNSKDLVSKLDSLTQDADAIIIENPVVGIYPNATLAFKKFAEGNPQKNVIYRIHDLIDDRPHLFGKFLEVFPDTDSIYPKTDNVTFLALTRSDKNRLEEKGLKNVHILPNSIITSNLIPDKDKSIELRKFLEEKRIIKKEEKILLYPVRVEKRKNIEEALLITKLLNNLGEKYCLVVTLPFLEDYGEFLKSFAREFSIPCSIGEVGKFIGFDRKNGFSVAELFSISDMAITTSIREGFGFVYVEPWISETPLIGRRISSVAEDFEAGGIDLAHLYGSFILPEFSDEKERINFIKSLLRDPEKVRNLSEKLNLKGITKNAFQKIESNSRIAIKNYDCENVARRLLFYISPLTCPLTN